MSSDPRPRPFVVVATLIVLVMVAAACSGDREIVVTSPSVEPSGDLAANADGDETGVPASDADGGEPDAGGFELPPLGDDGGFELPPLGDADAAGDASGDTDAGATLEAGFLTQAAEATSSSTSYRYEMSFAMRISDPTMELDISPDEPLTVGALSGDTSWMLLDMSGLFDDMLDSLGAAEAGAMNQMLGDDLSMEVIVDGGGLMYLRAPMLSSLASRGALPGADGLRTLGDGWGTIDLSRTGILTADELAALSGAQGGTSPESMIELLRAVSTDLTDLGRVDVRGVATTHLRAEVSMASMIEAQGMDLDELGAVAGDLGVLGDVTLPFEVFVDDDGRVRRMVLTIDLADMADLVGESAPAGTDFSLTTSIDLYDYGADITIDPPSADEIVVDLTDAMAALTG